jgi:two-component system, LytTR family, sensor kinase
MLDLDRLFFDIAIQLHLQPAVYLFELVDQFLTSPLKGFSTIAFVHSNCSPPGMSIQSGAPARETLYGNERIKRSLLFMTEATISRNKLAKWTGLWLVWTLFALFFASQFALQNQLSRNPVPFWQILVWQMVSGYVWFALSPVILFLAGRFPFDLGRWKTSIPVHLAACIVIPLVQQAIDVFILTRLGYPPGRQFSSFLEAYQFFIFVNLHLSILIYWSVVGIRSAYGYYQKYRERELKTSQLEARLAQSRLQVLKMQLHPHFLFNTLNAISELIHRDPEAADRMITDLSDLLRLSFENLELQEVPLKQELEFLTKYLEIEQTRFHDRLQVEMSIAADTLDACVPNMILQPLVENAIKHGIAPRSEGGRIDITSVRRNGHLLIEVRDDGMGLPGGDVNNLAEGVGLSNTRRRLKHLYGDGHTFRLVPRQPAGLSVDIAIPYKQS